MDLRPSGPGDHDAIERVFREVGWLDDDEAEHLATWLEDAAVLVAELGGDAEAVATRHHARMCVDATDLPVAPVTSVAVSRVARRRGAAASLTARTVVDAAAEGAALAVLGMFDQGFYDRLGFGTGSTVLLHQFDPSTLHVDPPARSPVRLTADDFAEMHATMLRRKRAHGGVVITDAGFTRAEFAWVTPFFGLGFRDDEGTLVDFAWGEAKDEHGPWKVQALVYRDTDGLLDLFGLLRTLGDQVHHVEVVEPPELSVQDLLVAPFRHRRTTERADHPARSRAAAWWQARVLDVPAVVGARRWSGPPVRFVVEVEDPLARRDDVAWEGVQGSWLVELADDSRAERGVDPELPTLRVGVGAFTRMVLGVAPASNLALTDQLSGPVGLLDALDTALATPTPPNLGMWF